MKRDELENYNTIQPKLTYKSRIIRNKTLYKNVPVNIKEQNQLEQDEVIQNKIEKTFTKSIPANNIHSNIHTARESGPISEQKEPKESNKKKKLKKNLSSYDIFVPKNSKKNNPSSKHFTFNDMKKKKRNSSVNLMNPSNKSKKEFNYACDNCYNNRIVTKRFKEQPMEKKDILNNTFNRANPFYFQDKMKDFYKDKIQHRLKQLEKIQRQAMTNLAKYKIENPTNVEKLQKQQELSINPMVAHEREDPRLGKTLRAYDLKENFINANRDLYQIDKPRKAINDYYNICCFQVPVVEDPYYVDPKYIKQVSIDLREQIEENKIHKKKRREEEIKTERISNKKMNDYSEFIYKKNKDQRKSYLNEFYKKSKIVDNFRKLKDEQEQKNRKDYIEQINKKMRKEDEEKINKYRQKKIDAINKLQTWKKNFENDKKYKKIEKEEENHKWFNYSQDYIAKCIHGNDLTKCSLCNQPLPKEKLMRYGQKSTDISFVSSKEASSQIVEKVCIFHLHNNLYLYL